jgi:DNA-binding response OmpR family regulator
MSALSERPTPSPARPRIVLVEDDNTQAGILGYALDASGFAVTRYTNGRDALDALLSAPQGSAPVFVLLDVDLPCMDGHSVFDALRAARPGAHHVVFLSAHAREADQLRALQAGALDYLVKPVSVRLLLAKLATWTRLIGARQ